MPWEQKFPNLSNFIFSHLLAHGPPRARQPPGGSSTDRPTGHRLGGKQPWQRAVNVSLSLGRRAGWPSASARAGRQAGRLPVHGQAGRQADCCSTGRAASRAAGRLPRDGPRTRHSSSTVSRPCLQSRLGDRPVAALPAKGMARIRQPACYRRSPVAGGSLPCLAPTGCMYQQNVF